MGTSNVMDFDAKRSEREVRELDFKIGGEDFTVIAQIHPDVIAAITEDGNSGATVLRLVDEMMTDSLVGEDAAERWTTVRSVRGKGMLTIEDIRDLVEWLVEETTNRPTEQPSRSSPGRKSTGTTSTAGSSSRATPKGQAALASVS